MLVDRSGRVWAMRRDDVMGAQSLRIRTAARERQGEATTLPVPATLAQGARLDGSDFARVVDGVAVIPVYGPLQRSMSYWAWSYEEVLRDIALAQADRGVNAIVLDIDSPGGLAAGCADAAMSIRASGPKAVHAFVGGLCASAAYWLASSAQDITVGSGTVVGSIGAVIEYVDLDGMWEKMGGRLISVVSEDSPNKRLDPESPEGRAEMQALVDAICAEFIETVARHRDVNADAVRERFGGGLVFDGAEAARRGMVDRRATLNHLIAELADRDPTRTTVPAAVAKETPMEWASLTAAALREHRADIVTELEAEARAAASATAAAEADGRIAAAVAAERGRILALDEVAIEGHEDLVASARADGRTTAAELALQIMRAEKKAGAAALAGLRDADATAAVRPVPQGGAGGIPDAAASPIGDRARATWDRDAAVRAEFGTFETYLAFARAEAAGQARLFGRAS